MSIHRYFNSRDIREHLKSVGYTSSALEDAWLVLQNMSTTLREKHEAWTKIVNVMLEYACEERLRTRTQASLPQSLQSLIADASLLREMGAMSGILVEEITLDDDDVLKEFSSATAFKNHSDAMFAEDIETLGIPGFDDGLGLDVARVIQPHSFSELVKTSGFAHSTGAWEGNAEHIFHSDVKRFADAISTRDDVLQMLTKHGMDRAEAYRVMEATRKGQIASGRFDADWEQQLQPYGIPTWYMDSMKKIHYLPPREDAVFTAVTAIQFAWFKAYYPLVYEKIMRGTTHRKGT